MNGEMETFLISDRLLPAENGEFCQIFSRIPLGII